MPQEAQCNNFSSSTAAAASSSPVVDGDIALAKGAIVEACFEGKGKWYPGKVDAVNDDGTYAILYDDGDREASVAPNLVRVCVRGEGTQQQTQNPVRVRVR